MDFMRLAATVCRELTPSPGQTPNLVMNVKNGNRRDVVTALDLRLHNAVEAFVYEADPSTVLLSEEDSHLSPDFYWTSESLVVLDPLDGSNNVALGLSGYGCMVTHLTHRSITSSLVVLPEHDLYLVCNGTELVTSQHVAFAPNATSATTYYAYPPDVDESMAECRTQIMRIIDERSSGLYRSGSACIGLFQLLRGAHQTFVGHEVRVWDVISYLPILANHGLTIRYRIDGLSATLITGHDPEAVSEMERVVQHASNKPLHSYRCSQPLVIGGP